MSLPANEDVLARLHPGLRRWVVRDAGWSTLSPIQRAAAFPILEGRDCIVEAPTAGGKTEAVLFPTLTRATTVDARGVRVLYLAPLRALLNNLERRGLEYARLCGLSAFKWHGDVTQKEKVEALQVPPALLMTTPESMEALLLRKSKWKEFFSGLSTVIIDEAHNFAAGDRGGHLLSLLGRIEEVVEDPPQRIAMSATVDRPENLLRWLAGSQRLPGQHIREPAMARVDRDFQVLFFNVHANPGNTPSEEHALYRRFQTLWQLIGGAQARARTRSLIFVRSRKEAENLAKAFAVSNRMLPSAQQLRIRTHHSAVSKFFREEAESLLQIASEDGLHGIVSTSTLELGIDIGALDRVVQMDVLASPSSLLQRVGRTGRRPGKPQFFRGLVTRNEDLLLLTATVNLALEGRTEALVLPRRAFHLLAHQLICLALQSFGIRPDDAWRILRGADCFSKITEAEAGALVGHMIKAQYLREVDGHLVVGALTEKVFLPANYRRLFAVFDSAPLYEVLHQQQQVGTLDAKFVESLEEPFFFVLGGKLWRADHVNPEGRVVHASPSRDGQAPSWHSFGGPDVPFETAQEAGLLLHAEEVPAFLDREGHDAFRHLQEVNSDDGWTPKNLVIQASPGGKARLITYAGDRINRTLARVLNLLDVGVAAADYQRVEFTANVEEAEAVAEIMERALDDLRTGRWSQPRELTRVLEAQQNLWPFSPFSRCLPPTLWAAALVEQSLDVPGLLEFLQRKPS